MGAVVASATGLDVGDKYSTTASSTRTGKFERKVAYGRRRRRSKSTSRPAVGDDGSISQGFGPSTQSDGYFTVNSLCFP